MAANTGVKIVASEGETGSHVLSICTESIMIELRISSDVFGLISRVWKRMENEPQVARECQRLRFHTNTGVRFMCWLPPSDTWLANQSLETRHNYLLTDSFDDYSVKIVNFSDEWHTSSDGVPSDGNPSDGNCASISAKSSGSQNGFKRKIATLKDWLKTHMKSKNKHLKHIEQHLIIRIEALINSAVEPMDWSKVVGLELEKQRIVEAAINPILRPDLYKGGRTPPKGILLFGPPGTGKSLLARCIAAQKKWTFIPVTVSTLTSHLYGVGEKMVAALFAVARARQPSIIFIDEIDSLLMSRNDGEHEATLRMTNEFLNQFDGMGTAPGEQLLIIGATNRPHSLDGAARRRFEVRLYIRLPDANARKQYITNFIKSNKSVKHTLKSSEIQSLADITDGYSCADMKALCREVANIPMRGVMDIMRLKAEDIRAVTFKDFREGLSAVKPTVKSGELEVYEKWNNDFGAIRRQL
ncbi:unnamed protein product [Oppiella nova]|uniref:AAA+ ATPase domain-containing protein n=1 Tax=Oppiella nova TaxID=334625 RepID=A0A7R9LA29_9ACAR|nr:unnamed protein product [Oppiella nova]CAG2161459.1 unnamed protein product [Oppiella nova]